MSNIDSRTQREKDIHTGKVMWVVNKVMGRHFFDTEYVSFNEKKNQMLGESIKKMKIMTV